ncbi:MAG: NADH-quinone oxidoreductase subunit NuoK [Ignavibacteriales bacterium]|nr:NADH-quinone oxidoreductase subunit NuoK [Ignavibacteriales bacterium]
MMEVGLNHFLVVSTLLFSMGIYAIVTRKNAIMVLMGVELILNSANINFIAFSQFGNRGIDGNLFGLHGHLIALFVIVLAAAEAAIALAIVLNIYKTLSTVNIDEIDNLKD